MVGESDDALGFVGVLGDEGGAWSGGVVLELEAGGDGAAEEGEGVGVVAMEEA